MCAESTGLCVFLVCLWIFLALGGFSSGFLTSFSMGVRCFVVVLVVFSGFLTRQVSFDYRAKSVY